MISLPSSDGVQLALHDFGGAGPPLLIAHATGFHAHCYVPVARELSAAYRCHAVDVRGHGESTVPEHWQVDWSRFGDDVVAAARHVRDGTGEPIVGVGHSMGGAALLMAACREPELFTSLVLFEPIAFPSGDQRIDIHSVPIVQSALRRRRRFASVDDAHDNFRGKAPLSLMTPEVLRLYVEHGFRATTDDIGNPCVELRCTPELEAGIFVAARENGVWELLPGVEIPVVVASGVVEDDQPSARADGIAERLPDGRYVSLPHMTHLGPFSHPDQVAALVVRPGR